MPVVSFIQYLTKVRLILNLSEAWPVASSKDTDDHDSVEKASHVNDDFAEEQSNERYCQQSILEMLMPYRVLVYQLVSRYCEAICAAGPAGCALVHLMKSCWYKSSKDSSSLAASKIVSEILDQRGLIEALLPKLAFLADCQDQIWNRQLAENWASISHRVLTCRWGCFTVTSD